MGSYASKPITDKESVDEFNERLKCGACSMQGWRVSQEDAHNCLLNFDTSTSYFAVYDGHGGHEVAQYCSQKLPDYIKNTEAYKEGDVEKALIDGFLGFDHTITTPEVISELKEIAMSEEAVEDEGSDDEENVNNLYEEALMPIEQVIEKYTSDLINPALNKLKKSGAIPKSPFLKAKSENANGEKDEAVSSSSVEEKSQNEKGEAGPSSSSISSDAVSSSSSGEAEKNEKKEEEEQTGKQSAEENSKSIPEIRVTSADDNNVENKDKEEVTQNGCLSQEKVSSSDSSDVQENGTTTPKGKGKSKMVKTPKATRKSPRLKSEQLYQKLLDFTAEQEDSEDEEDVTFDGTPESSDDDEDTVKNPHLEGSSGESSDNDDDDDADGEDNDEDDDDEDDDEDDDDKFTREMKDEPGSDSGCTAVVALLKDKKLWVANAGDSRCVVCRNGKAIEMSFDHKPEDIPERERINKAGGHVSADGRVNNGLNLSRAIGDHAYKQNTDLGPREQMITALPDVKTLDVCEEDEFMILACDGIWNFMTSQEVVDFIRPKIQENRENLSSICEELFDHCLAPDTMGDGTGCDNMTAIIVQFKLNRKRSSSENIEPEGNKKLKTVEPETTVD